MITVLDLGISNIGSVVRALQYLGLPHQVSETKSEILSAEKIMLPGVGSFKSGVEAIEKKDLKDVLRFKAIEQKVPFLGICLGMQLMFSQGVEGGTYGGLDFIRGEVIPLRVDRTQFPVPHMGWNEVASSDLKLFEGIPDKSCFYFVHGFEADARDEHAKIAFTEYGGIKIAAAVEKNNIWGVQFHAERSQKLGLDILKNFQRFSCFEQE